MYDIFDNIADTSDLRKDTDQDGVKDYYEKEMAAGHLRLGSGVPLTGVDYQNADSDHDGLKDGQELTVTRSGNRIFVKMTSNPTLPDSDFDGSEDKADAQPLNNTFTFKYKNLDYSVNADVSFTMDYRLLFRDNTEYSSVLSRASSLLAAGMYPSNTLNGNHTNALLSQFGMKDVVNDVVGQGLSDHHECGYALGYREVTYQGKSRIIVAVMVRGTSSAAEWSSNFNVGSAAFDQPADWKNTTNHMGFDIAANRIYDKINTYLTSRKLPADQIVYWVAGHSRGAGVANILSARLADEGKTVFGYTYATPNTTTTANANTAAKYVLDVPNDMLPYCGLHRLGASVCQTPAYFMQHLAMASSANGKWDQFWIIMDYDMAPRYEHAKVTMVKSALTGGGVEKPHLPISYYLLSMHVGSSAF